MLRYFYNHVIIVKMFNAALSENKHIYLCPVISVKYLKQVVGHHWLQSTVIGFLMISLHVPTSFVGITEMYSILIRWWI